MEGDYTNGQESNRIFMKDSLLKVKEMEGVLFGGLMEVGMKVNSEMVSKVAMEYFIEMAVMLNMKVHGIMVCLMVKVLNSSRTDKNTKAHLSKTNSMEMEFSIKMIPLFMEFGKIMSYRLLIW